MNTLATWVFLLDMGFGLPFPPEPLHPIAHVLQGDQHASAGKQLFDRRWKAVTDSETSDGLGPLFNADSCNACHPTGGSADNTMNVQLISFVESKWAKPGDWDELFLNEGRLLPSPNARAFMLPRNGPGRGYERWRLRTLGLIADEDSEDRNQRVERVLRRKFEKRAPVQVLRSEYRHDVVLSERNTPALFGAGLIDKISLTALKALEARQAKVPDGIEGRVPMVGAQPGRFGWRGQTPTLKSFVENACANELGLQTATATQIRNPLDPHPVGKSKVDINELELMQMLRFVERLPPPVSDSDDPVVAIGRSVMQAAHCDRCHVENVEGVEGIFSDLLLHDMGSGLLDPIPARPKIVVTGSETITGSGYFGAVEFTKVTTGVEATNTRQEWRTPPLWGVADSAPYLHDGRAASLTEAILMHGGEAAQSRQHFVRLPRQGKQALITFLKSLKAPW